jgi:prolyl-tRNA editing enzyme YbaK/EbsC (Cys-tRNA(Pro) deacylase)
VDARVMTRARIVLGGGSRSWKVIAPPQILLTLPGVQVVDGLAVEGAPADTT